MTGPEDLTTGRRRGAVLAKHFRAAIEPMRQGAGWWPNTLKPSAWVLLRVRELGPANAVGDRQTRAWLHGALREWHAERRGSIPLARLTRRLTEPSLVSALEEASDLQLCALDPAVHGDLLMRLFRGLEGIKSSEAQLVAVSKTLYHLLPDLVVPMDGEVTCGFFDWRGLPHRASEEWIHDVYSVFSSIASAVGHEELDRLGQPDWPRDAGVARALRVGQARVVDFGMKGYCSSEGESWYVP